LWGPRVGAEARARVGRAGESEWAAGEKSRPRRRCAPFLFFSVPFYFSCLSFFLYSNSKFSLTFKPDLCPNTCNKIYLVIYLLFIIIILLL
jgi:hypothetical protein